MYANICWSANTEMSMSRSPLESHAFLFLPTFQAVPRMFWSFSLDNLCNGRKVAVQHVFCGVLLIRFVQIAHRILAHYPSSFFFSSKRMVYIYSSIDTAKLSKKSCYIYIYIHMVFHKSWQPNRRQKYVRPPANQCLDMKKIIRWRVLGVWKMLNTPSGLLFPGQNKLGVEVPVRVLSMGSKELFYIYYTENHLTVCKQMINIKLSY